ncbi:MAG TPA: hypothetical protein PLE81_12825, partial [Brevundimonas sp.]|uniref:hypothetical protein n=1 Tax=Brevundimonas sp. TaxID=1871086 RepID=UPI002CECC41B
DWRDGMGDRWRDLDVGGRFRRLDLPGRAAPVRDRAVRYARDHAVEGVSTLAAVAAILGAVAVAMHERRDQA